MSLESAELFELSDVPLVERLPEPIRQWLSEAQFLGNTLFRWGVALLVFLATLGALRILKSLVLRRLRALSEKREHELGELFERLVGRTRQLFLWIVAAYLGSLALECPDRVEVGLERLVFIAFVVQAGIWGHQVLRLSIEGYVRRKKEDEVTPPAVLSLFSFFGQLAIWTVVLLVSLENLGFDVTALIAGLGVGGIALGLALQNVLQDTFASLSIILDKPFQAGDFIIVGDFPGTVEKIGVKTTRVRSLHGEQLIFGNSDILSSRVRNFGRMRERRILFTFGVVYQTPADRLARIPAMVREIVEAIEQARFDRAHFKELGEFALVFEVVYYVLVPEYNVYMDVQQRINLELCRKLEQEGIDFAYPTRTLYMATADESPAPEA